MTLQRILMYSAAAHDQINDNKTVNWNQVCTATSVALISSSLSLIKKSMPTIKFNDIFQLNLETIIDSGNIYIANIDGVMIYKGKIVIPPTKLSVSLHMPSYK